MFVLNETRNNSAPGPDNILTSFLKKDSCIGSPVSINEEIPSMWSQNVIQLIPKTGGDPFNPVDYRGIPLESIVPSSITISVTT